MTRRRACSNAEPQALTTLRATDKPLTPAETTDAPGRRTGPNTVHTIQTQPHDKGAVRQKQAGAHLRRPALDEAGRPQPARGQYSTTAATTQQIRPTSDPLHCRQQHARPSPAPPRSRRRSSTASSTSEENRSAWAGTHDSRPDSGTRPGQRKLRRDQSQQGDLGSARHEPDDCLPILGGGGPVTGGLPHGRSRSAQPAPTKGWPQ